MKTTILITGGTGFLGSNLCIRLINEGNRVICVDNNYTGSFDNVREIATNQNFKFILHDIINPLEIDEHLDQIYNLACPASPPFYQGKHSVTTTKTCVIGSLNMLELAKKHGARILQSSTSEVYGDSLEHPQKESYRGNVNPIGIRACYDEGKRCAESLFFDYWRHEGVEIKVARIFNTFGPKMNPDDGRVVSNFIMQALRGEDITIYGDGSQTRSFCYVDDLIEAMIRLMNSPSDFCGPVNIGNPTEFTIKELADKVLAKINSKSKLTQKPLPLDDPKQRKPDITLAKENLKWEPKTTLDEGLDKTIAYFKTKANKEVNSSNAMKIAIIGTGYVGLPTGVGFAELGHNVVCIDKNSDKISDLNAGKITLFEDGLEELFNKNLANGRIKFTTEMSSVSEADFIIIAVGTPPNPITKEADISYIYAASDEIASYLQKDKYVVVANKSTVPVGTGDKVDEIIKNKNPSAQFDVISMPEFLREGFAVYDFFNPSRVVVGANSEIARESVERLYSIFQTRPNIFFTERRSAELIKYASNAFLAVKIHYINEIADFCEKVNVNVYDVAKGMGLDCRIGNKFLNPGPGYGGSCFPKDTNALAFMAREKDVDLSLIEATIVGNDNRKIKMANRIFNSIKDIEKPLVAVWGLAFKDGTDDVRESPAIQIIQELISRGVKIVAYDPKAMESAKAILGNAIEYANNPIIATKNADVLAILTEWKIFKEIPLNSLSMRHKLIIDLRRIIDKEVAISAGFDYDGVGKK